jgi:hypothetical protein
MKYWLGVVEVAMWKENNPQNSDIFRRNLKSKEIS